MNKILLIGCGHMGSALLKAWAKNEKYIFLVVDPKNYSKINLNYGGKIKGFKSIEEIEDLFSIDILIFAVKPQIIKKILNNFYKYSFKKNIVFVSIIAGINISFFKKFLHKSNQFIRIMPNMPALINQGMSCLVANNYVTKNNSQ